MDQITKGKTYIFFVPNLNKEEIQSFQAYVMEKLEIKIKAIIILYGLTQVKVIEYKEETNDTTRRKQIRTNRGRKKN